MPDFIPPADTDFTVWMQNFIAYANSNQAALGLTSAQLTPIQTGEASWETAYAANVSAQAQAMATRQTKDDERSSLTALVRPLVAQLQASTVVTDAHRQALGITVRATTRTTSPTPTTRPVATVDTSQRLQHTISFGDESTPGNRAKPDGVSGCEIWTKIGEPAPVDPSELKYLATDTRTPYVAEFDGADAGKMAYYMLRWVNTRGERGPWSQTVGGTITN
jgi:hypothetical protein